MMYCWFHIYGPSSYRVDKIFGKPSYRTLSCNLWLVIVYSLEEEAISFEN